MELQLCISSDSYEWSEGEAWLLLNCGRWDTIWVLVSVGSWFGLRENSVTVWLWYLLSLRLIELIWDLLWLECCREVNGVWLLGLTVTFVEWFLSLLMTLIVLALSLTTDFGVKLLLTIRCFDLLLLAGGFMALLGVAWRYLVKEGLEDCSFNR